MRDWRDACADPAEAWGTGAPAHQSVCVGGETSSLPSFDINRSAAIAARRFGEVVLRVVAD